VDGDEQLNKGCSLSFKTMKYLSEVGVKELPSRFILPEDKRPNVNSTVRTPRQYDLPVIDISSLEGPHHLQIISAIGSAFQQIVFFFWG
jgi:hypothetical protein